MSQEEDLGEYVCVAENEFGRRTRAATLLRKGVFSLAVSSVCFCSKSATLEMNAAGVMLCAADEVPFVVALCGGLGIVLVLMVLVLVLIACRKSRASALTLILAAFFLAMHSLSPVCSHMYSPIRAEDLSESSSSCSAAAAAANAEKAPVLLVDMERMSAEPRAQLVSSARSTPAHVQLSLPAESLEAASLGARVGSVPALQLMLARPSPGRPPLPHPHQLQLHPQLGHALFSCPPACAVPVPAPGPTPLPTAWTQLTPSYKRYSTVLEPSTPQTPLPLPVHAPHLRWPVHTC